MKSILKRFLKFIGIELKKVNYLKLYRKSYKGKPLYIEIIGPGGIGKTHLLEQLKNNKLKFVSKYEYLNTSRHKGYGINSHNNKIFNEVIEISLNRISSKKKDFISEMNRLSTKYIKVLEEHQIITSNKSFLIITDEGLVSNYPTAILKVLENGQAENRAKELRNRAFIYLKSTPEVIVNQILKREEKTGRLNPSHVGKSREMLIRDRKIELELYDKIIQLLRREEIPILELDISKGEKEIIPLIKKFLLNLRNN